MYKNAKKTKPDLNGLKSSNNASKSRPTFIKLLIDNRKVERREQREKIINQNRPININPIIETSKQNIIKSKKIRNLSLANKAENTPPRHSVFNFLLTDE